MSTTPSRTELSLDLSMFYNVLDRRPHKSFNLCRKSLRRAYDEEWGQISWLLMHSLSEDFSVGLSADHPCFASQQGARRYV